MILTIKLFTFAFDVHDGWSAKKDDASVDDARTQVTGAGTAVLRLSFILQFKISSLPNPLEFLSFVYFFPAFLGGPAFEYKRYADFIDKKYSHTTIVTVPATASSETKKKITVKVEQFKTSAPASWLPVLRCFGVGEHVAAHACIQLPRVPSNGAYPAIAYLTRVVQLYRHSLRRHHHAHS
jgi:hypothetical protein